MEIMLKGTHAYPRPPINLTMGNITNEKYPLSRTHEEKELQGQKKASMITLLNLTFGNITQKETSSERLLQNHFQMKRLETKTPPTNLSNETILSKKEENADDLTQEIANLHQIQRFLEQTFYGKCF